MTPDVANQLTEIECLEPGWWGGKGVPADPVCLAYVRKFLRLGFPTPELMIDLYLTGGVEATWRIEARGKTYSCSFSIEPMEVRDD